MVRGSCRSWVSTRRAVAPASTGLNSRGTGTSPFTAAPPAGRAGGRGPRGRHRQREERRLQVGRAGLREDLRRRCLGQEPALAHEQQVVAPGGFVHHVAGHQQRCPVGGQAVKQRPQVAAQHRVKAHRRLVEDEQVGTAEQRDRQADAGELAAGERADQPPVQPAEVKPGDGRRDGLRQPTSAQPEHRPEVPQVLAQGQVRVDGGRLGRVPDAGRAAGDVRRAARARLPSRR